MFSSFFFFFFNDTATTEIYTVSDTLSLHDALPISITSAENRNALPFRKKLFREQDHHGSLAGASHGEIPNANDCAFQALLLKPAFLVQQDTQPYSASIEQGKWPKENAQKRVNVHRPAPFKCMAIFSSARPVAPRLPSTRLRALSLISFMRCGLRSNAIHAKPTSSGLSTWMAAPAATKREAISAKFSIEGPKTGTLPNAAGSRILCPPDGTSEPPTKAPSASPYTEANSPMLSSRITL